MRKGEAAAPGSGGRRGRGRVPGQNGNGNGNGNDDEVHVEMSPIRSAEMNGEMMPRDNGITDVLATSKGGSEVMLMKQRDRGHQGHQG